MKRVRTFIIFIGLLICEGCVQNINWYPPGPEKSLFDVATIQIFDLFERVNLELEIDGQPVDWKRKGGCIGVLIHILPGEHRIKWKYTSYQSASGWAIVWAKEKDVDHVLIFKGEGTLDAQKGANYEFHFAILEGRKQYLSLQSSSSRSVYAIEVRDRATWIEQVGCWHPKIVVGNKPAWTEPHTCEICGKEKAAPCEYGCYRCRSEKK